MTNSSISVRMSEGPQTPAQARVVDPVLTNVARGYRNAMLASHYLFPVVLVGQRGGNIITFGAEDFSELNTIRAPGANRQRINFGHSGGTYTLVQRALDGVVPLEVLEDANAVPGINYSTVAVRKVMQNVMLQVEIAAAALATTAGNYSADHTSALAGRAQWDHEDSTPAKAVENKKEMIAESISMEPNTLVVGPQPHRALMNNPDVIDRIKHTEGLRGDAVPMVTPAKLAAYFDVEHYVVARARKGKPGAFKPIWGNVAIMAYSDVSSMADMGSASFGYTYRLAGYPVAMPGRFDSDCDSWVYPTTSEDTPVIAGKDAGYLFTGVTGG